MSAWKSRWSSDRLVNAPTVNSIPPTRPIASAWLETSIATFVAPRSRMTASSACVSGASGVVKPVLMASSPMRVATVPIRPLVRPAACNPARRKNVVVVLPLVPVTPSTSSSPLGSP